MFSARELADARVVLGKSEDLFIKPQLSGSLFSDEGRIWINDMKKYVGVDYSRLSVFGEILESMKDVGWNMVDAVMRLVYLESIRETELMEQGSQSYGDSSH